MAKYTDHEEDYIYYYKFLCGFTHGNIKANLKFYACFIDLLGNEFNYSLTEEIKKCWDFEGDNNN